MCAIYLPFSTIKIAFHAQMLMYVISVRIIFFLIKIINVFHAPLSFQNVYFALHKLVAKCVKIIMFLREEILMFVWVVQQ